MRSRTGCLTCRQRKLKCDEQQPICGQCTKARRNCVASPGVIFRHQQNASLNGDSQGSASTLKNFYGYKETFGEDSVWVQVPKQLTFIHTTNPYENTGNPQLLQSGVISSDTPNGGDFEHQVSWQPADTVHQDFSTAQGSTHGLEALSAAASGDHYLQDYRQSEPLSRLAQTAAAHELSISPPIDPQLHSSLASGTRISDSQRLLKLNSTILDDDIKSDDDVPFLLRYFSEGPGAWMDLFDLNSYFSVDVPVKASACPLLLYAAIALSAKALAQIRISAQYIKQSSSKRTPSQWLHKARYYYDIAIGLLRQALEQGTRAGAESRVADVVHSPGSTAHVTDAFSRWRDRNSSHGGLVLPGTDSEELVATTAVLCVYEFLDGSGSEWSRHLDGAKSLFDIAREGTLPLTAGLPGPAMTTAPSTKGRKAVFWNICRQEMIDAFINNKQTRLDTSDMAMWRSAGLHVSQSGFILPSNKPDMHTPMADDMIANALVWLIMKLVNFIAAGDDFPHELGLGIRQKQLLDYWEGLEKQLDVWYEGLPDSFHPTSEVWPSSKQGEHGHALNIPKKWFARPMCASAMQSYHFARIQLLANKPHLSTGLPDARSSGTASSHAIASSLAQRHASYATILSQSRRHAEDIISIGLALNNDSARIHSVQALYTAGQVLGKADEGRGSVSVDGVRKCILDLLQGIQRETGWSAEYRMQELIESWGLPTR